jgi:hypothetical protein
VDDRIGERKKNEFNHSEGGERRKPFEHGGRGEKPRTEPVMPAQAGIQNDGGETGKPPDPAFTRHATPRRSGRKRLRRVI